MDEHKGFAIWLTGLPAAGKSTVARLLQEKMEQQGLRVQLLDAETLRKVFTPEPTYSLEERDWFYRSLVFLVKMLTNQGINVIIAATGHRRVYRDWGRAAVERFAEVYVNCLLSTCIRRDRKGAYRRALTVEGSLVPGVNVMYEAPQNPELVLDSEHNEPQVLAQQVFDWAQAHYLKSNGRVWQIAAPARQGQ